MDTTEDAWADIDESVPRVRWRGIYAGVLFYIKILMLFCYLSSLTLTTPQAPYWLRSTRGTQQAWQLPALYALYALLLSRSLDTENPLRAPLFMLRVLLYENTGGVTAYGSLLEGAICAIYAISSLDTEDS